MLLLVGLFASQTMYAQTNSTDPQIICFGTTHPYRVDYTENSGAGTTGSTYAWTVLTPGFLGTITPNQGPGASSNAISINWGTTPAGIYVLQVIESNGGCPGAPMTLNIQVVPLPTIVASDDAICIGSSTTLSASGASTYTWSPATGLSGTTGSSVTANPTTNTTYTITGTDGNGCINTTTVDVTVNPLPLVAASSNVTICEGASTTLTASGASTYTWSPSTDLSATSGSSVTASPTSSITYTVTGTDANGCINTDQVDVTVTPLPTISVSAGPTCSADLLTYSVEVTVSAGTVTSTAGSVVNTSGNIWTISGVTAGTNITVTVTNASCPNTLTINAPNCACPPVAAPLFVADASYCIGGTVPTISVTVPSGVTVDWYNQASGGTLLASASTSYTPSGAGTYYAEGRDIITGCVSASRTAVTVTQNALPTISAGPNVTICEGQTTTLNASGGVSYAWSPSTALSATTGSSVDANPTSTITYTVTGTDGNSCVNSGSVTVTVTPLPTITITAGPTCAADLLTYSVTVSVSGGTVTSTAGTVVNTSGNNWTISGITTGTNITLTVTNAGCPSTLAVNAPNCACPTVSAPGFVVDAAYCIGGTIPTISVTVPSGITVDWYDQASGGTLLASGTTTFTPTGPGTYYAEARDIITGCVSATRTPVVVTENPLPTVDAGLPTSMCAGDSVVLTASGASTYSWSPSASLSSATGNPVTASPAITTTYTVTGTDANGCVNTDTVVVTVNPVPTTSPIFHD
jgi:hypothetical protein